ncbi:alpha/beta fold hydrolase [Aquimarina rhabdastrellae]
MIFTYKQTQIHYTISGQGKPLIFLHGFLENSTIWKDLIPHFSNTFQCITIDLFGHGQTKNLGYIHTMEEMAQLVHVLITQLQLTQYTLIGHSMGGYVALAYIDLFPDTVSNIVLLNSTSLEDSSERKLNRDRAIAVVKKNPNAYTSMAIANLFAPENRASLLEDILFIKEQAAQTSLQGIIAALEGMKIRKNRLHILKDFTGGKLILAGKKDPVLSYNQLQNEALESNTNLISFDGGHMSYLENKTDVISTLNLFLVSNYTS